MKKRIAMLMLGIIGLLTGCGSEDTQISAQVTVKEYESKVYETMEIVRGDLAPVLELNLEARDLEKISYYPRYDEMEINQVYVQVGDIVSKGDILISFKSGSIEEQIDSYEAQLVQQQLLLDHYTNLSAIDLTSDYTQLISQLKSDMEVTSLYIDGLNAKLDSYNIVAQGDGMVTSLSDVVNLNTVNSSDNLITVTYDDGEYFATTADDYDFVVGDVYYAEYAVAGYDMELIEIIEEGKDENGNPVRTLCFKSVGNDEELPGVSTMKMIISKGEMKDVIYIPQKIVEETDEGNYVYILDENNCKQAVYVETGISVDGYVVITEGLSVGDRVVTK